MVILLGGIMKTTKKLFSKLLVLVLVLSLLPFSMVNAKPRRMKINKSKATVYVGKTVKLKIKNKGNKKVKWKSKNRKIATVTKKGLVKGKKKGKTSIIAKVGKKTFKCKITVKRNKKSDNVVTPE